MSYLCWARKRPEKALKDHSENSEVRTVINMHRAGWVPTQPKTYTWRSGEMWSQTFVGQLTHHSLVPTPLEKEGLASMPHASSLVQLAKSPRSSPVHVWRGPHPSHEKESKGHRDISSSSQQNPWGASKYAHSWAPPPEV